MLVLLAATVHAGRQNGSGKSQTVQPINACRFRLKSQGESEHSIKFLVILGLGLAAMHRLTRVESALDAPPPAAQRLPQRVEPTTLCRMRVVGSQNRSEIELDPVKAYRRARALDAMLPAALPCVPRGVTRGTHEHFNRLDAARQIEAARKLNAA